MDKCTDSRRLKLGKKRILVPVDSNQPQFILETMMALIDNEFFDSFWAENQYLFENRKYRQDFLKCLSECRFSQGDKESTVFNGFHEIVR